MSYTDTDFNSKKILITGGAGFIGSNLAFYFQENYPNARVVVFDRLETKRHFPMVISKALAILKIL